MPSQRLATRGFTWIVTLLPALLAALIAWGPNSRPLHDPVHAGRPLSQWLVDLDSCHRATFTNAEQAVRALGGQCLPLLRQRLQARDSRLHRCWLELSESLPIFQLPSAEVGYSPALQACRALGPVAAPLVEDILPFLVGGREPEAVKTLMSIGTQAVPALVRELATGHPDRWEGAVVSLGSIVEQPETVIPALQAHRFDPQLETRHAVAWALARFERRPPASVPSAPVLAAAAASRDLPDLLPFPNSVPGLAVDPD